jgi:hypothetical protein
LPTYFSYNDAFLYAPSARYFCEGDGRGGEAQWGQGWQDKGRKGFRRLPIVISIKILRRQTPRTRAVEELRRNNIKILQAQETMKAEAQRGSERGNSIIIKLR